MRRELEPLPDGVQLVAEPAPDVEFVVLNFDVAGRLPALFDELPGLRVIQSLSAGVDWLLPKVPPGIVVCRAVGVHDASVSEWVVAVILATRRRLLEWETTAASAARGGGVRLRAFLADMSASPLLALTTFAVIAAVRPASLSVAAPILGLWIAAPLIAFALSRPMPSASAKR